MKNSIVSKEYFQLLVFLTYNQAPFVTVEDKGNSDTRRMLIKKRNVSQGAYFPVGAKKSKVH